MLEQKTRIFYSILLYKSASCVLFFFAICCACFWSWGCIYFPQQDPMFPLGGNNMAQCSQKKPQEDGTHENNQGTSIHYPNKSFPQFQSKRAHKHKTISLKKKSLISSTKWRMKMLLLMRNNL
jgi:hypothetical protein